ncbi:MAG: hypothetical protein EAZ91_25310 [Cytophagales bacterium]|nr:MAG: hypothetical protein EAZ91_25310 [Cytophagales bacterium]
MTRYLFLLLFSCLLMPSMAQEKPSPLAPAELDSFHDLALRRIRALEEYIQTIADKKRSFEERDDAIKNALKLFVKGATIQVSRSGPKSIKNGNGSVSQAIPIEKYFQRLKNLNYSKVKVTDFGAARLSDWVEQSDGSYQATGMYFQAFKAWKWVNGKMVPAVDHKDRKKIDVDLRMREDPFYKENHWMVLFENITVDGVGESASQ